VHVAFLGLGQIGGSIARAVAGSATRITAWTPSGTGPRAAVADGIAAAKSIGEAIDEAELVVLAAPPLACLELLDELAAHHRAALDPDAVITDVASTKVAIVDRAKSHGLRFVGGHPMAGRESAGYGASDPELFRSRPWVIVPPEPADPAAEERVAWLASSCAARPVRIAARDHDTAVAAISHAPLVVAAALVEATAAAEDWALARSLAAGGWASMTRLATGDPTMGAGILATNGPATVERLRSIRASIDAWIGVLDSEDAEPEIRSRLEIARRRLAE
jgi:prephenate dehydrogenase